VRLPSNFTGCPAFGSKFRSDEVEPLGVHTPIKIADLIGNKKKEEHGEKRTGEKLMVVSS